MEVEGVKVEFLSVGPEDTVVYMGLGNAWR